MAESVKEYARILSSLRACARSKMRMESHESIAVSPAISVMEAIVSSYIAKKMV